MKLKIFLKATEKIEKFLLSKNFYLGINYLLGKITRIEEKNFSFFREYFLIVENNYSSQIIFTHIREYSIILKKKYLTHVNLISFQRIYY